jgi:hypothetical protein
MVLRKRIVAHLSARRSLTESLVTLATCYRSRAAGACLLSVLLMSPERSLSDPGATPAARGPSPAAAALAVSVSETPDAVRLRIQASGEIAPGSVEVRFAGRKAVVLARDAADRAIRSHPVRLPAPRGGGGGKCRLRRRGRARDDAPQAGRCPGRGASGRPGSGGALTAWRPGPPLGRQPAPRGTHTGESGCGAFTSVGTA